MDKEIEKLRAGAQRELGLINARLNDGVAASGAEVQELVSAVAQLRRPTSASSGSCAPTSRTRPAAASAPRPPAPDLTVAAAERGRVHPDALPPPQGGHQRAAEPVPVLPRAGVLLPHPLHVRPAPGRVCIPGSGPPTSGTPSATSAWSTSSWKSSSSRRRCRHEGHVRGGRRRIGAERWPPEASCMTGPSSRRRPAGAAAQAACPKHEDEHVARRPPATRWSTTVPRADT